MQSAIAELNTDRLRLRAWQESDREPFAVLNADPVVMEHFPACLSRAESDDLVDRIEAHWQQWGFGLWAVEQKSDRAFIGFIGLKTVPFEADFTPAVEIAWRLAQPYWGQGFASEGAKAALQFGFEQLQLDTIVSFTAVCNQRSQRLMQRLGLQQVGTFEHPALPEGDRLRTHVLYRGDRQQWQAGLLG
ncbi:GNAT family N-acetyltransferase [Synechococcus elongatus]|uniref:GNAT family N-acetyltransferase n=1 Tax=Synechococcus elongatus TaxID=32046 RepID=UPI000F7EAD6D|nr:GNAT family N-acetyltransferase [Synechococcus elongatus]